MGYKNSPAICEFKKIKTELKPSFKILNEVYIRILDNKNVITNQQEGTTAIQNELEGQQHQNFFLKQKAFYKQQIHLKSNRNATDKWKSVDHIDLEKLGKVVQF